MVVTHALTCTSLKKKFLKQLIFPTDVHSWHGSLEEMQLYSRPVGNIGQNI